jgi:Flp pilus assembly protein TadG
VKLARHNVSRDTDGSAAIEFAISVPILVSFIWGIFQIALLFEVNAGVQHALGQAARAATIYPTPDDATILNQITSSKFGGVVEGTFYTACPDTCITTDTTAKTKTITVTYSQPTNFLFFAGPSVTIKKSKTVYLSA